MLLKPLAGPPRDTFVGIVSVSDGEPFVTDEVGTVYPLSETPAGVVLYALERRPLVLLVRGGRGRERRWNHDVVSFEIEGRKIRLVRGLFDGLSPDAALAESVRWADWLRSWGAAPGSFAGSARSLLRATLPRPVRWRDPKLPPKAFFLGGRIERFIERSEVRFDFMTSWDIRGAYPSAYRELDFPREYLEVPRASIDKEGFSLADVRIPKLPVGPLPFRRQLKIRTGGMSFPTGEELTAIWSHNELRAARDSGCIVNVRRSWIARGRVSLFSEQWEHAVAEGRNLGGIAGRLAKATTNAAWGLFAMTSGGEWWSWETGDLVRTPIEGGRMPESPALAARVVARVRERLYREALCEPIMFVGCHTDGLLAEGGITLRPNGADIGEWQPKYSAIHLDYLHPTKYRMFVPDHADAAEDGWIYKIAGKNTPAKGRDSWRRSVLDTGFTRRGRRISEEIEARRKAALPWTERVESS